ncbi:MAG: hypothetical protein PHU85_16550, partial [Phycisphaerae bacterium]|nr:hypothetical protein [Phycisphaerae bacterium]
MRDLLCLSILIALSASVAYAEDLRATGANVLVVYQSDGADADGNGKCDSQELADYYAARRGVPAENLLGLALKESGKPISGWKYKQFFDLILKPVADKLATKSKDGAPLSEQICYLVTMPGLPIAMDTGHSAEKDSKDWFRKTRQRSADQYLVSIAANLKAGVNEAGNCPGDGKAGPLGAAMDELVVPIFGIYGQPGRAKSFRQMRADQPEKTGGVYLVTRLGLDLATGRDMLDGSLYAERYLRLPEPDEKTNYRPAIWLDQKTGFAADQVASMMRAVPMVQGVVGGPFARGEGLNRLWPLVIDAEPAEIGLQARTTTAPDSPLLPPHIPTVVATISR